MPVTVARSARGPISPPLVEGIAGAMRVIELDAVPLVTGRVKWRRWRYDELAGLVGTVDDWMYPGRIRSAITGGEARTWMRRRFRLWWTSDNDYRAGILFTADPRTGMEWDRVRITARLLRDADYLADAASGAAHMQPMFRPAFLRIGTAAEKVIAAISQLQSLRSLVDG